MEKRNAYRILVGKPEGSRSLGRPRRRWEDNNKMDLRDARSGGMDRIDLPQDRNHWRALVKTVMNFLLWLYNALLGLGCFFSFLIYTQTVGLLGREIRPLQGRYLHTEQHKHRINARRHPCLEWDSNPVFERAETVHALDRAATVISSELSGSIKYWKILEWLRDWRLLTKGSAPWS
jgi:hypothetical protein